MSAKEIQTRVDQLRAAINAGTLNSQLHSMYIGRLAYFETLLKEKADAGQMA
jgi:hypothetical protein